MSGIQSSGMHGFSEEGQPDGWDMAVGEVYGYRWWKMHIPAELAGYRCGPFDGGPFTTYGHDHPLTGANGCAWKPGRMEAECPRNNYSVPRSMLTLYRHEPPEYREACGCGFWAYFNPKMHVSEVFSGMGTKNPYRVGNNVHLPVFGVIRGTGRVIIGTKGFRTQYAEIVGLCVSDFAKAQLNWDIQPRYEYPWQNAFSSVAAGRRGFYTKPKLEDGAVVRSASSQERLRRYAAVEALLSVAYPDTKILCDEDALRKYFPPDKNYGPGSQFQLDNKYGLED